MNVKSRALVFILIVFVLAHPVYADVGIPPWSMPGTSVDAGETTTRVQMVSEEVLITITDFQREDVPDYQGYLAANLMKGHADATFVMRNHGDEMETFDVWFPMWSPEMYAGITEYTKEVENFAAWVDGEPVEVSRYLQEKNIKRALLPWATWTVAFPPGQDVEIRVAYDTFPTGNRPYGTFHYILETGADWQGSIGEGTITFRLPYEVNEFNTALNPNSRDFFKSTAPTPGYYTISGTDVTWRFTDLEPTADDNVQLTVMVPAVWNEIAAAQREADENPDSAQAQMRLAIALADGLQIFKTGVLPQANSKALADAAVEAFQRSLDLAPENAQVGDLVRYLELSYWLSEQDLSSLPDGALVMLKEALDKNPEDVEPVVEYLRMLYELWDRMYYDDWENAPLPSDALLAVLTKTAEIAPDKIAWVVDEWERILEIEIVEATPTPTALPTSTPKPTPTLVPTSTPAPTPTQTSSSAGMCAAPLAVVLGPVGVAWIVARRKGGQNHAPRA